MEVRGGTSMLQQGTIKFHWFSTSYYHMGSINPWGNKQRFMAYTTTEAPFQGAVLNVDQEVVTCIHYKLRID